MSVLATHINEFVDELVDAAEDPERVLDLLQDAVSAHRPASDFAALRAALVKAGKAALGDSNDREIEALNEALDEALSHLNFYDPTIDDEVAAWAERRDLP